MEVIQYFAYYQPGLTFVIVLVALLALVDVARTISKTIIRVVFLKRLSPEHLNDYVVRKYADNASDTAATPDPAHN